MGDHQGQARPQGYIVRIETKQGCVYRPKTIAQQLAPGASGDAVIIDAKTRRRLVTGMTPAAAGQRRRYRFPVAPHIVMQTVGSSNSSGSSILAQSASLPQGKSKTKLGDDSIELGIDLARSDLPLPGEHRTRAVPPLFASEAEQDTELYRRGILYHNDNGNSADGLDDIEHTQPAYTVRLVDAKKRRGKKTAAVAAAAAKVKVDASTDTPKQAAVSPENVAGEQEEEEDDHIQLIKELPVPEGLRLFTLGNLWEEESPGVGGDSDAADRLLGHEDINLHDIENIEYVLIDDDDLHSMAASWVELDSVAESDDWT